MNGRHILRMEKHLTDNAAAEVVGPAKFGPAGAELVVRRLSQLVAAGDRSRWAYSVFGELAPSLPLAGVDNPGCFWAEVDTTADAAEADRRIPRSLVQLARRTGDSLGGPRRGSHIRRGAGRPADSCELSAPRRQPYCRVIRPGCRWCSPGRPLRRNHELRRIPRFS